VAPTPSPTLDATDACCITGTAASTPPPAAPRLRGAGSPTGSAPPTKPCTARSARTHTHQHVSHAGVSRHVDTNTMPLTTLVPLALCFALYALPL
jgi:hypothetical protein